MHFFVDGRQPLGFYSCQQFLMPATHTAPVMLPSMPLCPTPCRLQAANTMIVMVPAPVHYAPPSFHPSTYAPTQVSSPSAASVSSEDTGVESEDTLSAIIVRNGAQIVDTGVIKPAAKQPDSSAFAKKHSSPRVSSGSANVKPFRCQWKGCDKSFFQLEPLKRHHRIHTGERPFLCDWPGCGKMFSQSTHRTVHMRSHTGERPYSCPICSRSFAHKSHVKRHSKIHNLEPGSPEPIDCSSPAGSVQQDAIRKPGTSP